MDMLGNREEWLDATARSERPAVRLGSCFPFQGGTLFVTPPRNLWPPAASSKVRWKGARFVPLSVVESLINGQGIAEDAWMIDGPSECLVPSAVPPVPGPFRVAVRSSAAVDRGGEGVAPHSTACLEFTHSSGLWTVAGFSGDEARERWTSPLTAAFRLLADSGIGGGRSRGWGRSHMPDVIPGNLDALLLKSNQTQPAGPQAYWILSLFHPGASDTVDWEQGNYALTTRGGRVESSAGSGAAKRLTRMVAEGSVLIAESELCGAAADVAPEGFPHPVYRSGFALAISIPLRPEIARSAA
jgi:CRISPR type III-A-associated RAMP protein Csm4